MAQSVPSEDLIIPLGTVLKDTYEISGVLGQGGMGTVFLANHLRLSGRQVAIKVLRHDAGLGSEVYVRFRREAEIATRLGHPNIIEVIDFDSLDDGSPFMVMEYLRGQPLSRKLRKTALSLAEVFSIARQMGSALQAAHRAGIVHRDLKPGNVFLVPTELGGAVVEHVKLLDFGISKVIDSKSVNTQRGILLGTPQYMAPEQATGKNPEIDPRTDIFCFGCMVYEMLARRLPFKDGPLPELVYRIVYDPPEPLASLVPGLPRHVITAVNRALQKRPEDRFPDVGAFIAELTGSPLQTPTPPPMPTPSKPVAQLDSAIPTVTIEPLSDDVHSKPDTVVERPRPRAEAEGGATVSNRGIAHAAEQGGATRVERSKPGTPEAPAGARSRKTRWGVAAAAGGVVIAAAAAALALYPGATPQPPSGATPEVAQANPSGPGETPPVKDGTAQAEKPPAEAQVVAVPSQPTQPLADAAKQDPNKARGNTESTGVTALPPVQTGTVPKPVLQDLAAAERALKKGDTAKALQLTLRTHKTHVTGTSYSLLTRAHCRQKDFASARAAWAQVPSWELARVRRYCKQYGLEL
jgi:serine/threonine-protein kinase